MSWAAYCTLYSSEWLGKRREAFNGRQTNEAATARERKGNDGDKDELCGDDMGRIKEKEL